MRERRPYEIEEICYKARLPLGFKGFPIYKEVYGDLVYYFDKNMDEVGYTVPWSEYVNEDTRGRMWSPSVRNEYHIESFPY